MINSYEKQLYTLLKEYWHGVADICRSSQDQPADIAKKIDRLQNRMKPKFETLAEDQAIQAWEQGRTYAELNLKKHGKS